MTMVSRLGYCKKCFEAKQPKTNQSFLVIGSTSGVLKPLVALRNGRTGMTPHFYLLKKVHEQKVYFQSMCAMEGCGTYTYEEHRKTYLGIDESKWSNWKATSLANWNALILFKDSGFEI